MAGCCVLSIRQLKITSYTFSPDHYQQAEKVTTLSDLDSYLDNTIVLHYQFLKCNTVGMQYISCVSVAFVKYLVQHDIVKAYTH